METCQLLEDQISLLKEARPADTAKYDQFLAQVEQARLGLKDVRGKGKSDILD
jgi:hypothetical protein